MKRWEHKIIHRLNNLWRLSINPKSTIILTNGCFDLLHYGHIHLLQTAKLMHEQVTLIVAVNSDKSVRHLKGPTRPLIPQEQRLAVVAALEAVDYCVLFDEPRCDQIIRTLQPDIWVKGGDYLRETLDAGEVAAADEVKAEIQTMPYAKGISTTGIIDKIAASLNSVDEAA